MVKNPFFRAFQDLGEASGLGFPTDFLNERVSRKRDETNFGITRNKVVIWLFVAKQNSGIFSVPRSDSEQDSVIFFFSRETGGIPTKQWPVPSCFVFRKIIFLLEIGNPTPDLEKVRNRTQDSDPETPYF